MRLAELATRALLGGVALEHLETFAKTSPNPANLLARQSLCDLGEELCADGCMPAGSTCCSSVGRDTYCDAGYYCMAVRGCCREGRTCTGSGSSGPSCGAGKEVCNTGCMPEGAACCPTGGYCDPGYFCTAEDTCRRIGSSDGGSGGGSGGGSSGPSTCDAGEVSCDTEYCIPTGGVCCNTGLGGWCDEGFYCLRGGCCRNGRTCSGSFEDDDDDSSTTTTRRRTTTTTTRSSTTTTSRATTTTRPVFGGSNDDSNDDDSSGSDDLNPGASTTTSEASAPSFTLRAGDGPPTDAAAGVAVPGALVMAVAGWVALFV